MRRLKFFIPAPLRALRWRLHWLRDTEAFAGAPARSSLRLAIWTLRELTAREILFSTDDGDRFVCMPNNFTGLALYATGEDDPAIRRFLAHHLRPGDVYVDAGANIGAWSIRAARQVGPQGRVVAFEAHPLIFGFLERNIAMNGLRNVTARNVALGAGQGSVMISYYPHNPGETHVASKTAAGQESVSVPLMALDDVLAQSGIGAVDYLKIDVEGFELPVLQGAQRMIAASPRIVVQAELVERHARRYGRSIGDVITFARQLGLQPHRATGEGKLRLLSEGDLAAGGDVLWRR